MPREERRKHPRIDSLNLLSYLVTDEDEQIVTQGVGRTLNVSHGGILLETHVPLDPEHTISLFVAMEDDLVDLKGKTVYTISGEEGKHHTGIVFLEPGEAARELLAKFIQSFQKRNTTMG